MRFLCVECDEPMSMNRTQGPDEGSMTVVFACPDCGRETAMLTNAMETQVVRSLGVSIGGREDAPSPMETVRSQLGTSAGSASGERDDAVRESPTGSGTEDRSSSGNSDAFAGRTEESGESNCPFTGTVEEAYAEQERSADDHGESGAPPDASTDAPSDSALEEARENGPRWTEAAEERLERIPPMARKMARRGIEAYAREEGLDTIDESVMDELKGQFRM